VRIAIVAAHGVIPQQQYGFGDEVAKELCAALRRSREKNELASRKLHGDWEMSVVFPKVIPSAGGRSFSAAPPRDPILVQKPQIVRVHRQGEEHPESLADDFFDIHEAYWSPIDKGKTNAASVVAWLVRTIFLPFNNVARYRAAPIKVVWDGGFILVALSLGIGLLAFAFVAFAWCIHAIDVLSGTPAGNKIPDWSFGAITSTRPFVHLDFQPALKYVTNPTLLASRMTVPLVVGAVGAYILAQAVHAVFSLLFTNAKAMARDPRQQWSRWTAICILLGIAAPALAFCALYPLAGGYYAGGWVALALVFAFGAVKGGQSLAFWFIANFFGDVQIYTTRDNNSSFFLLREAILAVVTRTILDVIQTPPDLPDYDRVYVFAHSLGSTISMDALIRVFNMQSEGLVDERQYQKIRGFVTFGTALEKTKYFFDAWSPTLSQEYDEFRGDIYGSLFTAKREALEGEEHRGIFWLNCWYFSDFVADKIVSYCSIVDPNEHPSQGTKRRRERIETPMLPATPAVATHTQRPAKKEPLRLVACNRKLKSRFSPLKGHFVTHGDYLSDKRFWRGEGHEHDPGALDVILSDFDRVRTVATVSGDETSPEKRRSADRRHLARRTADRR
jgi:hypothetical protein